MFQDVLRLLSYYIKYLQSIKVKLDQPGTNDPCVRQDADTGEPSEGAGVFFNLAVRCAVEVTLCGLLFGMRVPLTGHVLGESTPPS